MKLWHIALMILFVIQVRGRRSDCRQCKAGHYAKRTCNELHDTICAQCSTDTYTPESNTRELCYSCSTCREGFFVLKSCTFRHDTVCGSCDLKDYSELSSYRTHCVKTSKGMQHDQAVENSFTSEDSLELGSGDGELIVDHGTVKPTVIEDVIVTHESSRVTNASQAQNETLDTEGSGGFAINVSPEEELESSSMDLNLTFTSTESILTTKQSTAVPMEPTTPTPETFNITSIKTTSTTLEPSSTTTSIPEQSSTTSSTLKPSSAIVLTTQTVAVTPEPTTSSPQPTTKRPSTTTTKIAETTTTTTVDIQTTTESTGYSTDGDGRVIIDLRGKTVKVVDLRTTTQNPKSRTSTVKTEELDHGEDEIIIGIEEQEEQEEDTYTITDHILPEQETEEESALQTGALGSHKMDEEDGIKVGIVIAIAIVAAIIFFVVGFLVSRYCRKKRSGSFMVKNDIENGSVKDGVPISLDQNKDGGIYDEIGKATVTPVKNGKPNGTTRSTEDVYAVPDKRKSDQGSPKIDEQLNVIKFIDDTDEDLEPKEGDKLLEDSDEKYSSFASIPNGSVKQNGDVTSNDYVSESSPVLSDRDTTENSELFEEAASVKETDDLEKSPLLEKTEVDEIQEKTSS
ncbi:serine-rich adhesin for platelets-like [Ostrea edulis]|uniref:serine-rich adhesin for platelets-like n=1 Tax=Ostrea edulis TaxID=37623 RepID=UPI0024AEE17C|nr:serine-rich adhesin for platelets-like [Ostrea edulis]